MIVDRHGDRVVICVIVRVSAVPVLLHWSENLQECGMDGKSPSRLQRAVSTHSTVSGSVAPHRSTGCFYCLVIL